MNDGDDSYGSRSNSECSRLTRSWTSSVNSYVCTPTIPLWSKQAQAMSHIHSISIQTHSGSPRKSKFSKEIITYNVDVYMSLPQLGAVPMNTTPVLQCIEPQYQLRHRYSDCRTLRRRLLDIVISLEHRRTCEHCQGLYHFLQSTHFPIRCPRSMDVLPLWHKHLVTQRQVGLERWLNQLLAATHKIVRQLRGCEGSVLILHELAMFFLELPADPR
ncbi:hypothetical protein THRCLA_00847 [Thraustotheca clavata]|uniref:PX domain-containing protein n=1 Tax=Thraustotheca clavata TaxID=74557 RepID=A0A1W0AAW1_9STRA|nr:hypothetical protein THRCLA_00847 [Thraustotheca clavata]